MIYKIMVKLILKEGKYIEFSGGNFDGKTIHPLWLRERLKGLDFLDKDNLQRLYEPSLLEIDIKITNFKLDNDKLKVNFSDDTYGEFNIEEILYEINKNDEIPSKKIWKNNFKSLPIHNYKNFNKSDNFLINILKDFHQLGFVIISGLSKNKGTVIEFAETLGPVRSTNFGKYFDVISKPNPNDLAYTSLALSAHADNPYRKPIPGIQLLHCISNEAKGGDSTLVDGMAVAEHLKENQKDYYDILTKTNVLFKFVDKDIILENWGKLIELDENNNFKQIRFSGRLDYVPLSDHKNLEIYYKARKKLYQLYASKEFEINFRLDSGMLLMFDNHRLLHGRSKYDPNTGYRHLQGCYIEHDATEGRLRRLLRKIS